jgi:hypothetical protein
MNHRSHLRPSISRLLFVACSLALALVGLNPAAAAPPPLTDLVDDKTAFALVVLDAPALVKGWDASPFARTWNDEQVMKFFAPMREGMKLETLDEQAKAATGKTLRELIAFAKGGALIAVPASVLADAVDGKTSDAPAVLIAVELGDNAAAVQKLLNDAASKTEGLVVETTNYAGVLVHTNKSPAPKNGGKPAAPTVSAMCEGHWLISPSYERVCAAIDAIKKGGLPTALGRSENFLRVRQRAGEAQALAYCDFSALYPVLLSALTKNLPSDAPFEAGTALKALGFDALRGIAYTVNFGATETRMTFNANYTQDRGLMSLLAYGPGAAPRPDWVPARWIAVSADKFDLRAAYAALESVLAAASPSLSSQVQTQITELNKELNIDLKRDLIGSLGSELIVASALPVGAKADQPPALDQIDQLYAVSLENPTAFLKAIEAIKRMIFEDAAEQMFTKRDYLGQTLYTYTPPADPDVKSDGRSFSYAIANRTLLVGVGSTAVLESALQGMEKKGDSFWNRAEVKAALANVPEGAPEISVSDLSVLVGGMFGLLSGLPLPVPIVDAAAKPDLQRLARYWGLATGYTTKDATGLFSVFRIANPKP